MIRRLLAALVNRRTARLAALDDWMATPRLAVAVEDQTPDDLVGVADVVREPLPDDVCCDLHNHHCEPPSELCCWRCTEAAHDTLPVRHADGSDCVLGVVIAAPTLREERTPDGGWLTTTLPPLPEPVQIDPPTTRPYTTGGMANDTTGGTVKLGRNTLCRACIDHRSNGTYELICPSCRPSLVGSAKGLPS